MLLRLNCALVLSKARGGKEKRYSATALHRAQTALFSICHHPPKLLCPQISHDTKCCYSSLKSRPLRVVKSFSTHRQGFCCAFHSGGHGKDGGVNAVCGVVGLAQLLMQWMDAAMRMVVWRGAHTAYRAAIISLLAAFCAWTNVVCARMWRSIGGSSECSEALDGSAKMSSARFPVSSRSRALLLSPFTPFLRLRICGNSCGMSARKHLCMNTAPCPNSSFLKP